MLKTSEDKQQTPPINIRKRPTGSYFPDENTPPKPASISPSSSPGSSDNISPIQSQPNSDRSYEDLFKFESCDTSPQNTSLDIKDGAKETVSRTPPAPLSDRSDKPKPSSLETHPPTTPHISPIESAFLMVGNLSTSSDDSSSSSDSDHDRDSNSEETSVANNPFSSFSNAPTISSQTLLSIRYYETLYTIQAKLNATKQANKPADITRMLLAGPYTINDIPGFTRGYTLTQSDKANIYSLLTEYKNFKDNFIIYSTTSLNQNEIDDYKKRCDSAIDNCLKLNSGDSQKSTELNTLKQELDDYAEKTAPKKHSPKRSSLTFALTGSY